ncbi:MAG: hypothetical protein F4X16_16180 [Caldilineaceae bacterium SB0661_bin_34]|nr:hypothetical protein [Caldilineaceae bacterium SB0661_bin_34]
MSGLRDLTLKPKYGLGDDFLNDVYVPLLGRAIRYTRAVGYFSSGGLASVGSGLESFIRNNGSMRLMASPVGWSPQDVEALSGHREIPRELADRLARSLITKSDIERDHLSVLAWLMREGRLETRIIIGPNGQLFHQKVGMFWDSRDDAVGIEGSNNETLAGWDSNIESLSVRRSWLDQEAWFPATIAELDRLWQGSSHSRSYSLPEAVRKELLKYAQHRPHPIPKPVSKSLQLYPHQQEGCDRLLAAWPESRLLADEVGLGKTITASAAMQALQAQGKCQRVLILAPANVCIQWQEELAEKFNMKVPRLVKNYLHNVDGSEHAAVNPLNEPMLIASWHLMRQPTWRSRLLQGPDWDLVIVDEAHHARRRSPGSDLKSGIRRPNQFLELLEEVLPQIARTLWLLTATPVQLHLVELFDLLNVIKPDSEPQSSPLGSWFKFERFYTALAAPKSDRNWEALGMGVGETVPVQLDPRKYSELKPFLRRQLTGFGRPGRDAVQDADTLVKHELQEELLESIRQRSPGSRLMLRRTRRDADMQGAFATRQPSKEAIEFASAEERSLYQELDAFLAGLWAMRHGRDKGFGFLLSMYRRRLTSSWQAIERTIQRALAATSLPDDEMELLESGLDASMSDEIGSGGNEEGFSTEEMEVLRCFAARIGGAIRGAGDPKISSLVQDLHTCRLQGRSMLVFTQFIDTLEYIRDTLQSTYGSQVGTYSGQGARLFEDGTWTPVSKEQLTLALANGEISILLCTDAASEGLNLQTASTLVNYDLPWNPMRVEQRIGRIDRINQAARTLSIRNYVMLDTVEEQVYDALRKRIRVFEGSVGELQPILGEVEDLVTGSTVGNVVRNLDSHIAAMGNTGKPIAAALRC